MKMIIRFFRDLGNDTVWLYHLTIDSFAWFFAGIRDVSKEDARKFISALKRDNPSFESAYDEAMKMDERELVLDFMEAMGSRRISDMRALEDRGLMVRDAEGNLQPTRAFNYYLDYALAVERSKRLIP